MNHRKVLVVEDNRDVLDTIVSTLRDAQTEHTCVSNQQRAIEELKSDQFSLAIVRGVGTDIRGTELCREIRRTRTAAELPILIMLGEHQLAKGAEALIAGANDLLIDPFEPRELQMRANIVAPDQLRRFDEGHAIAEEAEEQAR